MGEGRDSTEGWGTFLGGRGGGGAPGGGRPLGGAFHLGGRGRAEAPRGINRGSGAPGGGGGGDRPPEERIRPRENRFPIALSVVALNLECTGRLVACATSGCR